jgi:hypothetical protein
MTATQAFELLNQHDAEVQPDVQRGHFLGHQTIPENYRRNGQVARRYHLPETYFSSVILHIVDNMASADVFDAIRNFIYWSLRPILLMLLCVWMQFELINSVHTDNSNLDYCEALNNTRYRGRFCAVLVFTMTMMNEFFETFAMMGWVLFSETVDAPQRIEYNDEGVLISGLTVFQKMLLFLLVTMPKLFISALVLVWGAELVALSETDIELALNSLGMCYLIEIDDIFFRITEPRMCQDIIRDAPAVEVQVFTPPLRFVCETQLVPLVGIAFLCFLDHTIIECAA